MSTAGEICPPDGRRLLRRILVVVATLTGSPCQLGLHDAGWAAPGEPLARTAVDPLFDRWQIGEGIGPQVAAPGKYWPRSPLVFSFVAGSQGLAGGAKKMPSAKYSERQAVGVQLGVRGVTRDIRTGSTVPAADSAEELGEADPRLIPSLR